MTIWWRHMWYFWHFGDTYLVTFTVTKHKTLCNYVYICPCYIVKTVMNFFTSFGGIGSQDLSLAPVHVFVNCNCLFWNSQTYHWSKTMKGWNWFVCCSGGEARTEGGRCYKGGVICADSASWKDGRSIGYAYSMRVSQLYTFYIM